MRYITILLLLNVFLFGYYATAKTVNNHIDTIEYLKKATELGKIELPKFIAPESCENNLAARCLPTDFILFLEMDQEVAVRYSEIPENICESPVVYCLPDPFKDNTILPVVEINLNEYNPCDNPAVKCVFIPATEENELEEDKTYIPLNPINCNRIDAKCFAGPPIDAALPTWLTRIFTPGSTGDNAVELARLKEEERQRKLEEEVAEKKRQYCTANPQESMCNQ